MNEPFSKRHSYAQVNEAEITVREDAPEPLRGYVVELAYECNFKPSDLRTLLCRLLKVAPDTSNWSEYPNINSEVKTLLCDCPWYKVYDFMERIYHAGASIPFSRDVVKFEKEINEYFMERGIGWLMSNGLIETRGPEAFQASVKSAIQELAASSFLTANGELKEAIHDLSRRPVPDLSGAIHHSMGALEAVCRSVSGDSKLTLGEVIKRFPNLVPRPLDEVVSKAWGYSSERGRHIREGGISSYEEAALVVGISASLCMYLALKTKTNQ